MMKVATILLVAAAMLGAGAANAAVFTGTQNVGTVRIDYALTLTDGLGGPVERSDLLAATFNFSSASGNRTFIYDPVNNGTSIVDPAGTSPAFIFYTEGASVNGTSLIFDYGDADAAFGVTDRAAGFSSFCATGNIQICTDPSSPPLSGELAGNGAETGFVLQATGPQVIASSAPEASTWSMMIAGAGAVGGALRRARRVRDAVAAA